MKCGQTGRYEVSTTTGEAVRAFIPAPLPPEPPVRMDRQRNRRHEQALLACGRLDSIGFLLPDLLRFMAQMYSNQSFPIQIRFPLYRKAAVPLRHQRTEKRNAA